MTKGTVLLSHGLHSGPRAGKVRYLSQVATAAGWEARVVDCEGVMEPAERVRRLARDAAGAQPPLVLAGSSLGAWVSLAASARLRPAALLLIAPAVYLAALPEPAPRPSAGRVVVAHGWHDDVVPVDNALRFAREWRAELHILDDGHRLADSLEFLGGLLAGLLYRVAGHTPSA